MNDMDRPFSQPIRIIFLSSIRTYIYLIANNLDLNIEPIEKAPLHDYLPGSRRVYSCWIVSSC